MQDYSRIIEEIKSKGVVAWEALQDEDKWKKEYVIAVFQSFIHRAADQEKHLPDALKKLFWRDNNINVVYQKELYNDRDVFLAYLNCLDFDDNVCYSRGMKKSFQIPRNLLHDDEVILSIFKHYPTAIINERDIPTEYCNRIDVFESLLQSELYSNNNEQRIYTWKKEVGFILSLFSSSILGNANLMIKVGKKFGINIVLEQFNYEILGNNVNFAIDLAKLLLETKQKEIIIIPDNSLRYFSISIRSIREIVLPFVQTNGLCMQDASDTLRTNEEIVLAAINSNITSVKYCIPGSPVQERIINDKNRMIRLLKTVTDEPQYYRLISSTLQRDQDIIEIAYRNGNCTTRDIPTDLMNNKEFLLRMITQFPQFWRLVPSAYQDDIDLVRAIESYPQDLVLPILRQFPNLGSEHVFWIKFFESRIHFDYTWTDTDEVAVIQYATANILHDYELMIQACTVCPLLFSSLSDNVKNDKRIVQAVIESNKFPIWNLPRNLQTMFPDLVAKGIAAQESMWGGLSEDVENLILTNIVEDLWICPDIIKVWFKAGGHFHRLFPRYLQDDEEFGLLVASSCNKSFELFQEATSLSLRSNKDFMYRAVSNNNVTYLAARFERDLNFIVHTFGNYPEYLNGLLDIMIMRGDATELNFHRKALIDIRSILDDRESFFDAFLFGMSKVSANQCSLSILDAGVETSIALKEKIASFLGIPWGSDNFRRYKLAAFNLNELPEGRNSLIKIEI